MRRSAALVASMAVLAAGCANSATSTGHPSTPPPAAPPIQFTPPIPSPSPSAAVTPPEIRTSAPGPEFAFRTQQGAGTLKINTYGWYKTKTGEKSAPPKNVYLVLDTLFIATEGVVQVNPMAVYATGPDKVRYQPLMGSDGNEPVLASKDLRAGENVGGMIAFDLPQGDAVVVLTDELGNKIGEAKIPRQ